MLQQCFGGQHHSRSAHAEEQERRMWLANPSGARKSVQVVELSDTYSGDLSALNTPLFKDQSQFHEQPITLDGEYNSML